MSRTKGRAKNLEPRPCEICQELFQPYTCRQRICGKPECKKEYDIQQSQIFYNKLREREKDREDLRPELRRQFKVFYTKDKNKWYWRAIGDNGSVLENGPFSTRKEAKQDFQEATE